MNTERFTIYNAQNEKIVGLIHHVDNPKGVAIVQHGLSGFKEQQHIMAMVNCCVEAGWQTIVFDSRHTFGESDGELVHATMSSYEDDLKTIIAHYVPSDHKLLLLGHSLGAASITNYACDNPERVFALAPLANHLSYDHFVAAHSTHDPEHFAAWKETGRFLKISRSKPGREGYVSWNLAEDMKNLKILSFISRMTMPVFLAVGSDDTWTPPHLQKMLFDLWPGPKELHVIPDSDHDYRGAVLEQMVQHLREWLAKLPD